MNPKEEEEGLENRSWWKVLFTEGYAGAEDVIKMNHLDAASATFLL